MAVKPIPEGLYSITPYLCIKDAHKALEYYKNVFGAEEILRLVSPDGKIGHCEIQIGNSRIMFSDEFAEWGNKSPQSVGGNPVNLCLFVDNVDEVFNKAVSEGAVVYPHMEVKDQFYGDRSGTLTDPFGYVWTVATHIEDVSQEEMQRRFDEMFAHA